MKDKNLKMASQQQKAQRSWPRYIFDSGLYIANVVIQNYVSYRIGYQDGLKNKPIDIKTKKDEIDTGEIPNLSGDNNKVILKDSETNQETTYYNVPLRGMDYIRKVIHLKKFNDESMHRVATIRISMLKYYSNSEDAQKEVELTEDQYTQIKLVLNNLSPSLPVNP